MTDGTFVLGGRPPSGWLGLGPARLVVLAAGLLLSLTGATGRVPAALTLVPAVLAVVWCFITVGGVPLHELATAGAGVRVRAVTGARQRRAILIFTPVTNPASATRPAVPHSQPVGSVPLRLPAACGRHVLRGVEANGVQVGVLLEQTRRGLDAVCMFDVVGDPGFALHPADEQNRQVAGWGNVLTALSGQHGDRCAVQWIETSTTGMRPPPTSRGGGLGACAGDASGDLPRLAEHVRRSAVSHRVTVALRIRNGHRDEHAALGEAEPLARLFAGRMLSAGLVAAPCDPDRLRTRLADAMTGTAWDPTLHRPQALDGPGSFREAWDHLRVDDTWHRSYLISGWPRTPVGPAWLSPMLTDAPSTGWRSIAVHLHPVRTEVAARRARARRQHALLDAEDRARFGFSIGARERRAQAEADLAEDELTAGHVAHRMAGLVLVSGHSEAELADAARHTHATATSARLELTPLHGRQLAGWAAALPLCRIGHRSPA